MPQVKCSKWYWFVEQDGRNSWLDVTENNCEKWDSWGEVKDTAGDDDLKESVYENLLDSINNALWNNLNIGNISSAHHGYLKVYSVHNAPLFNTVFPSELSYRNFKSIPDSKKESSVLKPKTSYLRCLLTGHTTEFVSLSPADRTANLETILIQRTEFKPGNVRETSSLGINSLSPSIHLFVSLSHTRVWVSQRAWPHFGLDAPWKKKKIIVQP